MGYAGIPIVHSFQIKNHRYQVAKAIISSISLFPAAYNGRGWIET
jgi:hypothetical protein